jgi:hypothetical protein
LAGSPAATRRRDAEAQEARRERLLRGIIIGVLVLVAVIVAVGLYVTSYLPPRAHVATIAGRDLTADDVVRRGTYFMVFEGGAQTQSFAGISDFTLDLMEDEALILERAPSEVGAVSDNQVEAELRERLGFEAEAPAFTEALADVIRSSGFGRDGYYELVRVRVLGDRLLESFVEDAVPTSAGQWHLLRVRVTTQDNADQVRERVLAGEDFDGVAQELAAEPEANRDRDWWPLDLLGEDARAAVEPLEAGDVSEVVQVGLFFDVYFAAEFEADRELDEEQRNAMGRNLLAEWLAGQRPTFETQRELSPSEDTWITEHMAERVTEALLG